MRCVNTATLPDLVAVSTPDEIVMEPPVAVLDPGATDISLPAAPDEFNVDFDTHEPAEERFTQEPAEERFTHEPAEERFTQEPADELTNATSTGDEATGARADQGGETAEVVGMPAKRRGRPPKARAAAVAAVPPIYSALAGEGSTIDASASYPKGTSAIEATDGKKMSSVPRKRRDRPPRAKSAPTIGDEDDYAMPAARATSAIEATDDGDIATSNAGRKFYKCPMPEGEQCDFFEWADGGDGSGHALCGDSGSILLSTGTAEKYGHGGNINLEVGNTEDGDGDDRAAVGGDRASASLENGRDDGRTGMIESGRKIMREKADGLCEYARLRLERIARNNARLSELGLGINDNKMEKKKKKKRRRSVILDGPRRKNPVRVCQLEDKGGAVVDGGGNDDVSDEVVSSPPLLRSDSGVDVVEPVGELADRMDPNSGRCWSCLVRLRPRDDSGHSPPTADTSSKSSVAPKKRAAFLSSTHTHPLLDIAVCFVCEERALAVESDVIDLEPQSGNDGGGKDDNGEDGTTTNSCSWCGLVDDELGEHDVSDNIPCSDLLLCDVCPRAFCVRCVILSHGGDVAAWEEVRRHTKSGSGSGSGDEEWSCPHCCPTSFLEKLRDVHVRASRDGFAEILGRIPPDIKSRFLEGGFAKWGGYWLPMLELGPFDVEPGLVRDMWFDEFRKTQENGRNMKRLVFWYGTKIDDPHSFSFLPQSKIVHYEEGECMGYGKIPKNVQQKIDKDSKLTKTEEQIRRGLIELKSDMKKDRNERVAWIMQWKDIEGNQEFEIETREDEDDRDYGSTEREVPCA
ncbi:hypothetical protein ACHAW5_003625 [Stephanodiscus triporus]|uniref:GRF-type domain-containing protein n=1 Tax=Stephanodiscus triporus TaxID=2934178 RepID=A0ABD3P9Z5_9STRA